MTSRELIHAIALHDRPLSPLSTPVTPIYNDSAAEALSVMLNACKIDSKMRFEIISVRLNVEYTDITYTTYHQCFSNPLNAFQGYQAL